MDTTEQQRQDYSQLEREIGYQFKDPQLLQTALTHSSFVKSEHHCREHNERLEFLGDAVLELCISNYLYRLDPPMNEGVMTRTRSVAVCEGALYNAAQPLELGRYLRMSRGEENTGGRDKASVVSDAFEALLGAIYLDGGFEAADRFVQTFVAAMIQSAGAHLQIKDHKTRLQELLQHNGSVSIVYEITGESGPDHAKYFFAQVSCEGEVLGRGKGRSKKEAEQDAAREALQTLEKAGMNE